MVVEVVTFPCLLSLAAVLDRRMFTSERKQNDLLLKNSAILSIFFRKTYSFTYEGYTVVYATRLGS